MRRLRLKTRLFLIGLGCLSLTAVLALHWLLADLPDVNALNQPVALPSVRIVDRYGRVLYDVIDQEYGRHTVLPLADMPLSLRQATIATEDKTFYSNPGVDFMGIARAVWTNTQSGSVVSGGSTITQQVVRNLLLTSEERHEITIRRKLREMALAWQVTRRAEKDDILALYLNQSYYGGMAYGVEAAARTYFGKTAADLTLAESALIAGLPQAPALYNPLVNPDAAKSRQEVVLGLMLAQGYITQVQHDQAAREPLQYAATPYPVLAPHFVMMVQAELDGLLSAEALVASGGVTVRTTLDLDWQNQAQKIVSEQIELLNNPRNGALPHAAHNAALVAMHPQTGEVMALVGNVDYFDEKRQGAINMALMPRQPGSSLKPIVYAAGMTPDRAPTAVSLPFTPATLFYDVRTVFITHEQDPYVPVNFSRTEHGPVLLRAALASSLNIPAVIALDRVGVAAAMRQAALMGIGTLGEPDEYDLSFALGGGPVRLFDLTTAYAAFANGGSRVTPSLILDVTDARGHVLFQPPPTTPTRVLDARVAWLISDMLSDDKARILSFGPDSILNIGRTTAVKTGTTNDFHDNWTVGYTPDVVVGVWVGNADNTPMFNVTGVSGAGPIWHMFMRDVLRGTPDKPFPQPEGLIQVEVCSLSGLRPSADCPFRRYEWFIAGTEPQETDTFYRRVEIDKSSGLLASETTPPDQVVRQLALALPPPLHPWARAEGLLLVNDLLRASGAGSDTATSAVLSPSVSSIHLISPDPQTKYRISTAVPLAAQKLPVEAVAPTHMQAITLWLDDKPLATLTSPPYQVWWTLTPGVHTMWAEGVDEGGTAVQSERIAFAVLPALPLSPGDDTSFTTNSIGWDSK
ncbi:MAG: transglycosylase domain-containing protein [Anaerolineae bacterium]|nr:transglycosylase domain-containing protein [Anaerolineae bacterium]